MSPLIKTTRIFEMKMFSNRISNLVFVVLTLCLVVQIECRIKKGVQIEPPQPKYGTISDEERGYEISAAIDEWSPNDGNNIWELSGLTEGDILIYEDHDHHDHRNGLLDEEARWINSTVPFYIDEDDFSDEQIKVILKALDEYHTKTCVRFRPYEKSDKNYVIVKGNSTGCWSSVGMRTEGQILHLQTPNCVRHGVVIHEFLHALGFFHQQSASNRDDFVKINWENILPGTEHNFNKYNTSIVTDYNVTYDYGSVMHYSEKAFSKNGNPTIEALVRDGGEHNTFNLYYWLTYFQKNKDQKLGQRNGLSEKDIVKLNAMYEPIFCHQNAAKEEKEDIFDPIEAILSWFE